MTIDDMRNVVSTALEREAIVLDAPSTIDWRALEEKFHCDFEADFRNFIALMAEFSFPGDIFNVSSGRTNGNDSIASVYDLEVAENPGWDHNMIPFYGIGSGDYFCLDKRECPKSRVFYFYADRGSFEEYSASFEEWVRGLPEFLD